MQREQRSSNGLAAIIAAIGGLFVAVAFTLIIVAQVQNMTKDEVIPECLGEGIHRLKHSSVPDGFCAFRYADEIDGPRGIIAVGNGDLLVVESGKNRILVLFDTDKNGLSETTERAVIATAPGLNHGIVLNQGFLYASSATTVYRWKYTAGARTSLGEPEVVITGMPENVGGHQARTLVFDARGRLYVSVGSRADIDADASSAQIKRFEIPLSTITTPQDFYTEGVIFASGLRNVGMRFDNQGVLHAVEDGMNKVVRAPFASDMYIENPADELHVLGNPDTTPIERFYGYPYCWSEGILNGGKGAGSHWAVNISADSLYNDTWCQNTTNVVPAAFSMPAHVEPLDILFYYGGSFTNVRDGDAFVSWHGSFDRPKDMKGFKVVIIRFDTNRNPVSWKNFFHYVGKGAVNDDYETPDYDSKEWHHRPVALTFGTHPLSALGEALYLTDDNGDMVIGVAKKIVEFDAGGDEESDGNANSDDLSDVESDSDIEDVTMPEI